MRNDLTNGSLILVSLIEPQVPHWATSFLYKNPDAELLHHIRVTNEHTHP
jgi:hypothetical protein